MRYLIVSLLLLLLFPQLALADEYTVIQGDTLWSIAQQFGMTVSSLAAINGISNPNLLHPGQIIKTQDSEVSDFVSFALTEVGKSYKWGGVGTNGYDCSGLVWQAYRQIGIRIPRTAQAQHDAAMPVSEPERGDLAFYGSHEDVTHVGIVLGDGLMVNATSYHGAVVIESVHAYSNFVGYGRL